VCNAWSEERISTGSKKVLVSEDIGFLGMMCGEATGQMPKTTQYQCQLEEKAAMRVQAIDLACENKPGCAFSGDAMTRASLRYCKSC